MRKYVPFDRSKDVNNVIPADEPDHVKGYTKEGFQYLIKRHPLAGSLLGYIRVPRGHKWYAELTTKRRVKGDPKSFFLKYRKTHTRHGDYNKLMHVDVHGGLTYSGDMSMKGYALPGVWVGFDCAHSSDLCPGYYRSFDSVYRDVAFVKREIDRLSEQMK